MTGRLLLVAQKLTPMLLQVQPTGREKIPPRQFDRLGEAVRGLSNAEIEEVAARVTSLLARRLQAPRPELRKTYAGVRQGENPCPARMSAVPGAGVHADPPPPSRGTTGGFEALFLLVNLADYRCRPAVAGDAARSVT